MSSVFVQRVPVQYGMQKDMARRYKSPTGSSPISTSFSPMGRRIVASSSPSSESSPTFSVATPTESSASLLKRLNSDSPSTIAQTRASFVTSGVCIPHPNKSTKGEDAHVNLSNLIGVADGVGGWSELGVDAGMYSRRLMHKLGEAARRSKHLDPSTLLSGAFQLMGDTIGTCTACVVTLDGLELKAANLGDSGFIVLRFCAGEGETADGDLLSPQWRVVLRSKKQQHRFNCPFQMGTDADDYPGDADQYTYKCEPDDIVIVATDGVFDNLFERQLVDMVASRFPSSLAMPRATEALEDAVLRLSSDMANEALRFSQDREVMTPFALEARENKFDYSGGKQDDITVVVGVVQEECDGINADSPIFNKQFHMKLRLGDENSPSNNRRKRERTHDSSVSPRPRSESF